jgi:hypothetical protein
LTSTHRRAGDVAFATAPGADVLRALARHATGDCGVQVHVGDFCAQANLQTREIFLPDPESAEPGRRAALGHALRALLYHEVGHLLFTRQWYADAMLGLQPRTREDGDERAVDAALRAHGRWGARFSRVATVIEDPRVDRRVTAGRAGLGPYYWRALRVLAHAEGDPVAALRDGPPFSMTLNLLLILGRHLRPTSDLPTVCHPLMRRVGASVERAALAVWTPLGAIEAATSLLEALERAGMLDDALEEDEPPEAAPPEENQGATGGGSGLLEVDEPGGPPTVLPAAAAELPCVATEPALRRSSPTGSLSATIEAILAAIRAETDGEGECDAATESPCAYTVATRQFDEVVRYDAAARARLAGEYGGLVTEARSQVGPLMDILQRELATPTRETPFYGAESGCLFDPESLPWIAAGVPPPDEPWVDFAGSETSACVAVLIDCSGSMRRAADPAGPSRAEVARLCAVALHEALKSTPIAHAIWGFTTRSSKGEPGPPELVAHCEGLQSRGVSEDGFTRWDMALSHHIFVDFGQTAGQALCAISGLFENMDGEAVAWASTRLRGRHERTKVMLVLSDGHPSGGRDVEVERAHLRHEVEMAERAGIHVVGLGIQEDAVRSYYPNHVVVHELGELPGVVLGAVRGAPR